MLSNATPALLKHRLGFGELENPRITLVSIKKSKGTLKLPYIYTNYYFPKIELKKLLLTITRKLRLTRNFSRIFKLFNKFHPNFFKIIQHFKFVPDSEIYPWKMTRPKIDTSKTLILEMLIWSGNLAYNIV